MCSNDGGGGGGGGGGSISSGKDEGANKTSPPSSSSSSSSVSPSNSSPTFSSYDDDVKAHLNILSSKSYELASLSVSEVADLARLVLDTIRNDSYEWSVAGRWAEKEQILWKMLPPRRGRGEGSRDDGGSGSGATGDDVDSDAVEVRGDAGTVSEDECDEDRARSSASSVRLTMGSLAMNALKSFIEAMELEQKEAGERGGDGSGAASSSSGEKKPKLLQKVRERETDDGNKVVRVYGPVGLDTLPGHKFEVWTLPDDNTTAETEEKKDDDNDNDNDNDDLPRVAVVLGAGNQSFLSLIDILQQCLVHRRTVLIKHHPFRPYLSHPYAIMLRPLIQRGYVRQILDGGVQATKRILSDSRVGHVHITGSVDTDRAVRKTLSEYRPSLSENTIRSMVTAELGCVTPCVIVPGEYSRLEIVNAAEIVASSKTTNGGCNCLAAQAVVLPKGWPQKDEFKKELLRALKDGYGMPAYYPQALNRMVAFKERYEKLGEGRALLIRGGKNEKKTSETTSKTNNMTKGDHDGEHGDSDKSSKPGYYDILVVECGTPGEDGFDGEALTKEAFGPVLALVELPGGGGGKGDGEGRGDDDGKDGEDKSKENDVVATYLKNTAVPFLNDKEAISGTLSCSILHTTSVDYTAVVEPAVSQINYGCIAINASTVLGYMAGTLGGAWGAHPSDMSGQSGRGYIGNHYGIEPYGKTVVRGPALTSTPIFASNKPLPPAIVFDAVYALTSSRSVWGGIISAWKVLVVRGWLALISKLNKVLGLGALGAGGVGKGGVKKSLYGSAI